MDCTPDIPGACSAQAPVVAPHGPAGAAWLVGTRVYVWQVVEGLEHEGSLPALAARLGLSDQQVKVALEYHERAPEELEHDRRRARALTRAGS